MNSAWLNDHDDPVVERVSRLVEDVTGLSTESAEELQVSNIVNISNCPIRLRVCYATSWHPPSFPY